LLVFFKTRPFAHEDITARATFASLFFLPLCACTAYTRRGPPDRFESLPRPVPPPAWGTRQRSAVLAPVGARGRAVMPASRAWHQRTSARARSGIQGACGCQRRSREILSGYRSCGFPGRDANSVISPTSVSCAGSRSSPWWDA
jgi:hypothetical protein